MESDRPTVIPSSSSIAPDHPAFGQLRELKQPFAWAAVVNAAGFVVAWTSPGGAGALCPALFDGVLGARPTHATASGSRRTSTLVALADGSFLRCEFPASVLIGEVFAALSVLLPLPAVSASSPAVAVSEARTSSGTGRTEAVLERELEDPNVEGAFTIDHAPRRMHFVARESATRGVAMDLVERGDELATEWMGMDATSPLRVFVQQRISLFGIANGKPRSTWLAFSAPVPRGVGFAAVESLAEKLDREREHTTVSPAESRET